MNEGAANLVDHVLPGQVPIRQWVLTLPYPLRYPLAFDPNHLGISSSSSLGPAPAFYGIWKSAASSPSPPLLGREASAWPPTPCSLAWPLWSGAKRALELLRNSTRGHVMVYSGVLASNSTWRRLIIPKAATAVTAVTAVTESTLHENAEAGGLPAMPVPGPRDVAETKPEPGGRRYSPWHELLRRTFGEEVKCPDCGGRLRLVALVKKEETIQTLLAAMHLPTQATAPREAVKPEPAETGALDLEWSGEGESTDWPEYPD